MSCGTNLQQQVAKLTKLVNELFCKFEALKQPVSSCLRVTAAGTWGAVGDIIQHIKWFNTPTSYVDVYINETQGRTVLGVTTSNTEPCAECGECVNPDDNPLCATEFTSTSTISFSDCDDGCFREVSADVKIIDANDNAIVAQLNGLFTDWGKLGWEVYASQTHPEVGFLGTRAVIRAADGGSDDTYIKVCGGHSEDTNTGASLGLFGNSVVGRTGDAEILLGSAAGSSLGLGRAGSSTSYLRLWGGDTEQLNITKGFTFDIKSASLESTGAGSAALGANCPAVTLTAPYKWLKIKTQDGSTAYIPAWK